MYPLHEWSIINSEGFNLINTHRFSPVSLLSDTMSQLYFLIFYTFFYKFQALIELLIDAKQINH